MQDLVTPSASQPFDEEAEVADFLPPHLKLEGTATLSSDWQNEYLSKLHRTMEDLRFLVLSPTGQLLYLHFLKKTHGIGLQEIAISIDRLVRDTKLAWATVQKQLRHLEQMGIIITQEPSRQRLPTKYLVAWLPPGEEGQTPQAELLTRYDQLDKKDLAELKRLSPLFSQAKRAEMAREIYVEYGSDGVIPTPEVAKKIIAYRILTSSHYKRRLMEKYPHWYGLPPRP